MNLVISKKKICSQNSNDKPIQFLVALATTTLNCAPPNCMYPPILEEGNWKEIWCLKATLLVDIEIIKCTSKSCFKI